MSDVPAPARSRGPAFLPSRARAREDRRRRAVLLGIAALLLLGLTPVVGRHLVGAVRTPLAGVDHLGPLCLVAVHLLLAPVHAALHALVAAGLAFALWDRSRVWRHARRTLAPLDGTLPRRGDAFWAAARRAGVAPERLRVVDGLPTPAFTAGWLRPVVYVARGLVDGPRPLAPRELAAVLAHEGAHLRRRDPLRFSALRLAAHTLFWIPALRHLTDDVADDAEIRADDEAAARTDPLTLAAALVTLASWGRPGHEPAHALTPGYVAGFRHPDLLERRVRRLAGEETAPPSRLTRGSLGRAALALAVVWASGIVDLHALPRDHAGLRATAALHCLSHHAGALSHLFCRRSARGGWITRGGSDCPHRAGTAVG